MNELPVLLGEFGEHLTDLVGRTFGVSLQEREYLPYISGTSSAELKLFRPFAELILEHSEDIRAVYPSTRVILLTACSYAKPYSHSFIHRAIRKALFAIRGSKSIEIWHLSSAGAIPSVLERCYPFCAYDWNNEYASAEAQVQLRDALRAHFSRWFDTYVRKNVPVTVPVVLYFRRDSNTAQAICNALPDLPSRTIVPTFVSPVSESEVDFSREPVLYPGSRDPDAMLALRDNLEELKLTLRSLLLSQETQ